MWLRLFLLIFLCSAGFATRAVTTQNGTIIGFPVTFSSAKAWQFLGIPFAEKPLGNLRFAKPRTLQKRWSEPLVANKAPNRCLQPPHSFIIDDKVDKSLVAPFDEDCLYLNIWTPENTKQRKAVMVWFHGGGYVIGEGLPFYHGGPLAALHDVIVVTVHYRVGAFGFLRLGEQVGGNWGMFDQQVALRWVQDNVVAFGGDPGRVTIFGESAGSSSVNFHLLSLESAPLFHRGIAQSGSAYSGWAFSHKPDVVAEEHRRFAAALNCSSPAPIECLRSKAAKDILSEQTPFRWLPVVDGDFLRAEPRTLQAAQKDVMMGVTEDEGGMITDMLLKYIRQAEEANPEAPQVAPEKVMAEQLFSYFPHYPEKASSLVAAAVDTVLRSHVNPQDLVLNLKRISKAFGDGSIVCPMNEFTDDLKRQGLSPFIYLYAHRSTYSPYPPHVGATHGEEIIYVFQLHIPYPDVWNMTAEEKGLASRMAEEWAAFAKTGRPASPKWRPFSREKKEFFEFALPGGPKEGGIHRDDCGFWIETLPKLQAAGRAQKEAKEEAEKNKGETNMWLVAAIAVLLGILFFRMK